MTYDNNIERSNNDTPPNQAASGTKGPNATLIAFVIVAVAAVIFVLQNQNKVETHFLFFTKTSKTYATIGVAIIVGVVLDRLFSMWWRRRRRNRDDR